MPTSKAFFFILLDKRACVQYTRSWCAYGCVGVWVQACVINSNLINNSFPPELDCGALNVYEIVAIKVLWINSTFTDYVLPVIAKITPPLPRETRSVILASQPRCVQNNSECQNKRLGNRHGHLYV